MIESIRLRHFGRFSDREFSLDAVTLFCGRGLGRTTIFDAFFVALCRPQRDSIWGKRLDHYVGIERAEASVVGDGVSVVDAADYFSLNAIRWDEFASESEKVPGTMNRELGQMPLGHRNLVAFAARLAVAEKAVNALPLLVIDDAFSALDDSSVENALRILHDFQRATNWQVVLFIRQSYLRERIESLFGPGVRVHELEE